jgi:hypothetical protein
VFNVAMHPVLRGLASALTLALSSSCFSPGADTSATDPATAAGSSAGETTGTSGVTGTGTGTSTGTGGTTVPTSTEPTGEPGTATSTSTTTSDPDTGTTAAPPSCSDGVQNGDETDLDCGGPCAPCEAPLGCHLNSDCVSMACLKDKCLAEPECVLSSDCVPATCKTASCVDFACQEAPAAEGAACDDGKVCTADDACSAGVCDASTPKMIALVDLPDDPSMGLYFDGNQPASLVGSSVGHAGDFNGDGIADLYVVGSKPNLRVHVLFGGPTLAKTTLADAANGVGGVMIDVDVGVGTISVASAGDVNDDDFADLLIGTQQNPKTGGAGGAYVIRGRADATAIKISAKPPGVGLLAGPPNMVNNGFGAAVAGLGDINGDAFDDFAVTAPLFSVNDSKVGAVYLVYGGDDPHDGNIEAGYVALGKAVRIAGPAVGVTFGNSVAGVGDFNNDGRRDVAIGQASWVTGKGRVYVLYTPANLISYQLATDPPVQAGLAVAGAVQGFDGVGTTVGGAGDFNADGYTDLIVGNGPNLKKVLVIYGGNYGGGVPMGTLVASKDASEIVTVAPGFVGPAVGGGLDVNGDGVDDVVIGAPASGANGEVYVAFGTAKGVPVAPRNVADIIAGKGGFAITGTGMAGQAGTAVALVPSVNGDALADVFIGAPGFDVTDANNEGRAYVLYGGDCKP